MAAGRDDVDFEARRLLDGLEGREREAREELLSGLLERGATLEELKRAVDEDRLVLLPLEQALGGRYSTVEVSERSGVPLEQLQNAWRALGFVQPENDEEKAFTDGDVAAAESLRAFLDAGISEDSLLEIARVLGEGTSRLSSTVTGVFVDTYLEPGDSERDVALRFALMAKQLLPLMSPVLDAALAGHVREATRRGIISRAERERGKLATAEEAVVCFADLVGFTSLGGEVGAEELGLVARRLGELATEVSSPTVRLVKTIGDAAMYVSDDAPATVNAALELIDAVSEADLPALRAGIACGAQSSGRLVRTGGQPGEQGHRRGATRERALHRGGSRGGGRRDRVVLGWSFPAERAVGERAALPSAPHRCARGVAERRGRSESYETACRSITKTSVALGGILDPDPLLPYARFGGMMSSRRPPTRMPGIPSVQPLITPPASGNWTGWPVPSFHDASNCLPVL